MKTQSFAAAVVLLLTCAGTLQAQTVRGVVVTASTHEPVEFANVLLQKSADSSLFGGTQTGKDGKFEFLRVPSGEYLMEISRVGYEVKKLPALVQASADSVVDLGTIPLADSAVTLEEVTVSSQKDLLNLAIDRKVYNVDQDIQSKSISASDILRNVPSVEVEIDGRVTLRGSNDVLIMIDGKTSPIMGTNKAEVLEQIPASAVKKIEVMTNPSAKYKPDAEAGIINIVLKKGSEGGLNGGFTVNAGNDDRYNGDLRLDYSHDNLTFFGSYSPRKDTRTHTQSESVTQSNGQTLMSYFDKNDNSTTLHLSHLVLLGGDLKIDEANKAGISGSYFGRGATTVGTKTTIKEDSGGVMSENISRNHNGDDGEPDVSVRTYFQHAFDDHQKMRADLKVSRDRNHDVSNFATVNRFPASPVSYDNTITSELGKQFELSLEYTAVLDSQSRLESGYSGQINSDDLDLYIDYLDPASHSFVTDVSKTNDFRHEETVHAAYTTYEHRFGQFGFKAGLRAEQVFGTSRLLTRNSEFENNYFSLYPSLHLSYDLDNGTQLQANYSRRIYRPEAEDLNPFPDYSDPTNLFAGNPLLLPMFIHSMELGCLFQTDKISFLPTAFYRYKYNRFSNVTTALNDSTLFTTIQNLSYEQSAGLEFVLSGSLTSFLTTNANADIFYQQIDASELGFKGLKSVVTWRGAFTCDFHATPMTRIQVNPIFHAARLTAGGEDSPYYTVNLGLRQDFLDHQLSLIVSALDIFKTWKKETIWDSPGLSQSLLHIRDSRIVYLGLTYRLGTPSKNWKTDEVPADDE